MRPLTLEARNVGRFPSLTLDLHAGASALVGPNGSGKSTILNTIEACLFAEGSRDLAPLLGPFGDSLEACLTFEHAGELYRVRRGFRVTGSGGKATLDFERWEGESPC
jgi:DNA repair exonuclease SbcCD ATPase subunit